MIYLLNLINYAGINRRRSPKNQIKTQQVRQEVSACEKRIFFSPNLTLHQTHSTHGRSALALVDDRREVYFCSSICLQNRAILTPRRQTDVPNNEFKEESRLKTTVDKFKFGNLNFVQLWNHWEPFHKQVNENAPDIVSRVELHPCVWVCGSMML